METRSPQRKELLRIQKFAEDMHISVATARDWVRKRRVSSCKPCGHVLIPASEIDRLISENMRPHDPSDNSASALGTQEAA